MISCLPAHLSFGNFARLYGRLHRVAFSQRIRLPTTAVAFLSSIGLLAAAAVWRVLRPSGRPVAGSGAEPVAMAATAAPAGGVAAASIV